MTDADCRGSTTLYQAIISRPIALGLGLKRYFTGRPCKYGHVSERLVLNWKCCECNRIDAANYILRNKEKIAKRNAEWYIRTKLARDAYGLEYRRYNKEKIKDSQRRCREKHPNYKKDYYKRNREIIDYRILEWRKANPEKVRVSRERWLSENKDRRRMVLERYYVNNKQKCCARSMKWKADNRNKYIAHVENRRARVLGAEGMYVASDIVGILFAQNGKCGYCKKSIKNRKYHVDHVIPLSRGGSNWPRNIQLLCAKCNLSKWATDPIEYARRIGRLL